jgi:hypothetical protein
LRFEPKPDWNRANLDGPAREAFVRKAKADRFAWSAAELLSKGKSADASETAKQGIALIGEENFASSCRRYATSVFQVSPIQANEFFKCLSAPLVTIVTSELGGA